MKIHIYISVILYSAGRSGVRIPGRGKCSLRTTAVDARVNTNFNCFCLCAQFSFLEGDITDITHTGTKVDDILSLLYTK